MSVTPDTPGCSEGHIHTHSHTHSFPLYHAILGRTLELDRPFVMKSKGPLAVCCVSFSGGCRRGGGKLRGFWFIHLDWEMFHFSLLHCARRQSLLWKKAANRLLQVGNPHRITLGCLFSVCFPKDTERRPAKLRMMEVPFMNSKHLTPFNWSDAIWDRLHITLRKLLPFPKTSQ